MDTRKTVKTAATPDSLVADAMFAAQRGDWPAVRGLCDAHPDHATVIRARVARLGRLGLVDVEADMPASIGPYRVVERLGRGGMGVVYRAEQSEPVRRQVAVKVVRRGSASRAVVDRFAFERQTLAQLQHPHIAQLFDAGETAEHEPYFAMELIDGTDLVSFCDESSFSVRQRIELMATVCEAVQHAHHKGVVHRDLKPSNILVRRLADHRVATPAIIDFGVAKLLTPATDGATATEEFSILGTPAYMSPEQARGDARHTDTRTDVYSLGVVLYEMLTGELPHDPLALAQAPPGDLAGLLAAPPARPSTRNTSAATAAARRETVASLRRSLRKDLDWVVLRAMEHEPARRYGTAGELAADLRRVLAHEPVLAGPPSAWYRLGKLARRHRAAFAATAVTLLALVSATAVSIRFALSEGVQRLAAETASETALHEAAAAVTARDAERRQRQTVEQRERELAAVAGFQADMLTGIDLELMGTRLREDLLAEGRAAFTRARLDEDALVAQMGQLQALLEGVNFTTAAARGLGRNVLDRALAAIDTKFADQPVVRGDLLQTVATAYRDLALYDAALAAQEEALRVRRETHGDDDRRTMASLGELALLRTERGERDTAAQLYERALAQRARVLGPDDPDTLAARNSLALILHERGESEQALTILRDVRLRRELVLGPTHAQTLRTISDIGYVLEGQGHEAEAEPYTREALAKKRIALGDDDPSTLDTLGNLAELLRHLGRMAESEACHREALARRRRVLGDDHPDTLLSLTGVAAVLTVQGRLAEAETMLQEAMATSQRVVGPLHARTLRAMSDLAGLYMNQGRFADAEPLAREVLARYRREYGDDHLNTITAVGNLGALLRAMGRPRDAEPFMREQLETSRRALGEPHRITVIATYNLGSVLNMDGRPQEAEPLLRAAIDLGKSVLSQDHPCVIVSLYALGGLLIDASRLDEAEPVVTELLERSARALGPTNRRTDTARVLQARLATARGRDADAEPILREVLGRQQTAFGPRHQDTLATAVRLGGVLRRRGALVEAEPLLEETLVACRNAFSAPHPLTLQTFFELMKLRTDQQDVAAAGAVALDAAEAALQNTQVYGRPLLICALACLDAWHAAEPDAGHDRSAAALRARAVQLGWSLDPPR